MHRLRWPLTLGAGFLSVAVLAASQSVAEMIEFTTREVTEPTLTVSPDGRHLIFSLLGHLFRLPIEGGAAEQLTFGPSYDNDPAFSPDGRRVAFVSDRDGGAANIFLLDLSTRTISQVTRESQAGQPVWSRDGRSLAYCRILAREEHPPRLLPRFFGARGLRELRRIALPAGDPEVLAAPRIIGSVFYLPDGRLAWTAIEQAYSGASPFPARSQSRIEVRVQDGQVATLRSFEGDPGRVVVSPAGDGLYTWAGGLRFLPLPEGEARPVLVGSAGRTGGAFVIAPDNKSAYLGQEGGLFKATFSTGALQPVAFEARVKMDVQDPVRPRWLPPRPEDPVRLRSVMSPQLSPDGRRLVFMAAGDLWQQPLPDGPAERILEQAALRRDPSLSPDGRHLAFAQSDSGKHQVRTFDFASRDGSRLASLGDRSWGLLPNWSRDGQRVVFQRTDALSSPIALMAVRFRDSALEKLAEASSGWTARPHFSGDDRFLYFTGRFDNLGTLYRLPLERGAKPTAMTDLADHLSDGLVSADGKWLAFRRNAGIWVAPLRAEPVKEAQVRRLSPEGGRNYAFTPDSSALIYAAGHRLWRHPLAGGQREEIPLRLELRRPRPSPLLLRRVRVLDLAVGGFGPQTSLLIEGGRIRWIGPESGRAIPPSAAVLDSAGRYVIPGLFDLHVHAAWANHETNPDAFIAYGITSVRDTGGRLDLLNTLSDRGELTADPLPRYFFSGEIFEGTRPIWGDAFLQIASEDDARAHVRLWKERGSHFIKVYPSLPWPLQRAVAEEARRLGLPVVGHGLSTEEIVKSVTLGYAVLEHGPSTIGDDLLQLLAGAGTRWDPTLAIMGGHELLRRDEPDRLDEAIFRTFVPEQSISEAKGGGLFGRMPENVLRANWKARLARVRAARGRGVSLQAGTDSLMTGTFFGPSLHWELEHFVEAGLSPLEAIRMASSDAAQAVGAGDDLGTIEPAKLADLVLLKANPLENIRNTRTIWRVVKAGQVFDPEGLRAGGRPGGTPKGADQGR
jgi:imidazolonepropionase-like amidohydrolase/Tol biopolymer transport system component